MDSDVSRDVRPVPDPTLLTTQQLLRELASLREIIEARLNGMDKAMGLIQHAADKVPSEVDTKIAHLQSLYEEKFHSVSTQLSERRTLNEQTLSASKEAINAAFQAAKEAVTKNETTTNKQIDQLGELMRTAIGALDAKVNDIKDRLTLIEGKGAGQATTQTTHQSDRSFIVAIIMAALVIIGLLIQNYKP